eukprot:scaffold72557_cov70-Phaeocystis_antarctica.AAC.3
MDFPRPDSLAHHTLGVAAAPARSRGSAPWGPHSTRQSGRSCRPRCLQSAVVSAHAPGRHRVPTFQGSGCTAHVRGARSPRGRSCDGPRLPQALRGRRAPQGAAVAAAPWQGNGHSSTSSRCIRLPLSEPPRARSCRTARACPPQHMPSSSVTYAETPTWRRRSRETPGRAAVSPSHR